MQSPENRASETAVARAFSLMIFQALKPYAEDHPCRIPRASRAAFENFSQPCTKDQERMRLLKTQGRIRAHPFRYSGPIGTIHPRCLAFQVPVYIFSFSLCTAQFFMNQKVAGESESRHQHENLSRDTKGAGSPLPFFNIAAENVSADFSHCSLN